MEALVDGPVIQTALTTPDHDILIELRTTVQNIQQSVNQVTTDHEIRLRHLEASQELNNGAKDAIRWIWGAIGVLGAIIGGLWWLR